VSKSRSFSVARRSSAGSRLAVRAPGRHGLRGTGSSEELEPRVVVELHAGSRLERQHGEYAGQTSAEAGTSPVGEVHGRHALGTHT